ncbi:hypothetical protein NMS_2535 [Nonlabens marinus S1-08]|uniref:Uncharacterized protein n=1 Tax=Nonlabens marinus S1-08 TaxID=1454201 RepID=W8VRY0_9FLAO|nr:hypothetical protein NMS_2535 [Nonlabens marinus S1-08]
MSSLSRKRNTFSFSASFDVLKYSINVMTLNSQFNILNN